MDLRVALLPAPQVRCLGVTVPGVQRQVHKHDARIQGAVREGAQLITAKIEIPQLLHPPEEARWQFLQAVVLQEQIGQGGGGVEGHGVDDAKLVVLQGQSLHEDQRVQHGSRKLLQLVQGQVQGDQAAQVLEEARGDLLEVVTRQVDPGEVAVTWEPVGAGPGEQVVLQCQAVEWGVVEDSGREISQLIT